MFLLELGDAVSHLVDLLCENLIKLGIDPSVLFFGVLFVAETHSKLTVKLIDVLAVFLFALVVAILSPSNVFLDLLILIDLRVKEDRDLTEELIPLDGLDVLGVNPQY